MAGDHLHGGGPPEVRGDHVLDVGLQRCLETIFTEASSNGLSFLFCFLYISFIAWKIYLPVFSKLCVEFISITKTLRLLITKNFLSS